MQFLRKGLAWTAIFVLSFMALCSPELPASAVPSAPHATSHQVSITTEMSRKVGCKHYRAHLVKSPVVIKNAKGVKITAKAKGHGTLVTKAFRPTSNNWHHTLVYHFTLHGKSAKMTPMQYHFTLQYHIQGQGLQAISWNLVSCTK